MVSRCDVYPAFMCVICACCVFTPVPPHPTIRRGTVRTPRNVRSTGNGMGQYQKGSQVMRETCFCGWTGDVADREPIRTRDGDWVLACPQCGHTDDMHWLPVAARAGVITDARRRASSRAMAQCADISAPPRGVGTDAAGDAGAVALTHRALSLPAHPAGGR
jgi:hypothetical protein